MAKLTQHVKRGGRSTARYLYKGLEGTGHDVAETGRHVKSVFVRPHKRRGYRTRGHAVRGHVRHRRAKRRA